MINKDAFLIYLNQTSNRLKYIHFYLGIDKKNLNKNVIGLRVETKQDNKVHVV